MASKQIKDTISFSGHPNILGTHYNTLEVTRANQISKKADCIIGVKANKACADLHEDLRAHIVNGGNLSMSIKVKGSEFMFTGKGLPQLPLIDIEELVLRRSDFVSGRTAAVLCSAAAINLPREMVRLLQNPDTLGTLTIEGTH